jgi:hypothetical protein
MELRGRKPTLTEIRAFRPVNDALWAGWHKATLHLQSLSDIELWHAGEWVRNLGATNCGWLVYDLRENLARFIAWEQNRREHARVELRNDCLPRCWGPDYAGHFTGCPNDNPRASTPGRTNP